MQHSTCYLLTDWVESYVPIGFTIFFCGWHLQLHMYLTLLVSQWILEFCNTFEKKKQYVIFLNINLIFFYLTTNWLIVGDKIISHEG
jgi:hypothetical protein